MRPARGRRGHGRSWTMLTSLHIQDFVLIDQLSLPLGGGLTALTGETGAGKSILLDALGLAVGGRADRGLVRHGAERGVVAAAFGPGGDHPAWSLLKENGLYTEDEEIILRRIVSKTGKSRAFVNDQPVSITLLRTVGACLLEIHGQHDGHGFLSAATHRALLDEFGGLGAATEKLAGLWRAWRDAEAQLARRRDVRDKALAEADYLRHVTAELEVLAPVEGEEEQLAARRSDLMAAEKVCEDLSAAAALLSEGGLEERLASCARRLSRAVGAFKGGGAHDRLAAANLRVDAALSEVMEARAAVEDAAGALGVDPGELEAVEERLFALRAAARKHAISVDQLPAFFEKAVGALAALDEGEAGFEALEAAAAASREAYEKAARSLSAARAKSARMLSGAVAAELAPLKLGGATFSVQIETNAERPRADGYDAVEFVVSTNPGAPAGPLKTIASGGELSRFVLAMKAALAAKESRTVIIFDEVDAGVGGAVADAVGERLARLARDAQVLVVTHSPQVAARADRHWRVAKVQKTNETRTHVTVLSADERIEEIARMLSGAAVTDTARAAAASLLGAPPAPANRARRKSA